jgi:hypothetical protein
MADKFLDLDRREKAGDSKPLAQEAALSPALRFAVARDFDRAAAQITNKIEKPEAAPAPKKDAAPARDQGEATLKPTTLENQPPTRPQPAPSLVPGGMSSHYSNTPRQRTAAPTVEPPTVERPRQDVPYSSNAGRLMAGLAVATSSRDVLAELMATRTNQPRESGRDASARELNALFATPTNRTAQRGRDASAGVLSELMSQPTHRRPGAAPASNGLTLELTKELENQRGGR